jgi:hypothetical protein
VKRPAVQLITNFQHIMDQVVSLLCSQDPSTGPYPEPDKSSPCHPILFI